MEKICIFGAGAVGGVIAARLKAAGGEVTLVARGENLRAIREKGLRLRTPEGEKSLAVDVTDDTRTLPPQDLVLCCVKSHSLPQAVPQIAPLLGPQTPVVFAMNGVPWWFCHGLGGALSDKRLESVDPGGGVWRAIGPERALGCAVLMGSSTPEPGVVLYNGGGRLVIGEPDGQSSARLAEIVKALSVPGLQPQPTDNIRGALFGKLIHNVSFNAVCAITHTVMDEVARDPRTRPLIRSLMLECVAVGKAVGVRIEHDVDKVIENVIARGPFRPSTQQDLEAGKPLEIDALVGVVCELGRLTGVQTPFTDAVYALIRRLAETLNLYVAPRAAA
jgi:2-dehydropantoate 2-reductase